MRDSDIVARLIVGLEIHVQLNTRTKLFCSCPVSFGDPPNTNVCPVCLGHPGAMPVLNAEALKKGLVVGSALGCTLARRTKWDRKSYFYPDLPKNYQISQYDQPIAASGTFVFDTKDGPTSVRIRRAHLEEDAGKSIHDAGNETRVDLNRAGAPLIEIVTEPDIASAEEAYAFCVEFQRLMTYLGVSEGVMQKGQLRFEPNVNLAILKDGVEYCTPIAEIKNLNSFRAVREAIRYEEGRQFDTYLADQNYIRGKASGENRGWSDELGVTEFQRPKEEMHDYRYFPDPDLVPVTIDEATINHIAASMPELPAARRTRLMNKCALSRCDAELISSDVLMAELFDEVMIELDDSFAVSAAKQFINIWLKIAADRDRHVCRLDVAANRMAGLVRLTESGAINRSAADGIAKEMLRSEDTPRMIAERMGLILERDENQVCAWVEETIAANSDAVASYFAHPKRRSAIIGFLRGQVIRLSDGKADAQLVGRFIEKKLARIQQDE